MTEDPDIESIKFAVQDSLDGEPVSPSHVNLKLLKEFATDVEAFLRGDGDVPDAAEIPVSIVPGSLALQIDRSKLTDSAIHDLELLAGGSMAGVDRCRLKVVHGWQARSRRHPTRNYSILDAAHHRIIRVNKETKFTKRRNTETVVVERYLTGYVTDMGGTHPNIHMRVDGKGVIVRANETLLRDEERNRLFKNVAVRVKAKYSPATGEMSDLQLISFVDYEAKYDPSEIEKLTTEGVFAWSGVRDGADWVRALRDSDDLSEPSNGSEK